MRVRALFDRPAAAFTCDNTRCNLAVQLTGDTGTFWFFGPANLEVFTKVLDGRTLNGKFWFFYGALSSVARPA